MSGTGWGVARAHHRLLVVVAALVTLACLGWFATSTTHRDYATGLWPIGLGTGAVLVAAPRWRLVVAGGVGAVAGLAVLLSDLPEGLVPGITVTAALEVWVAARVLRRRDGERPELRADADLRRYFGACFAAGGVGVVAIAGLNTATSTGDPLWAALGVGLANVASHLYLVPFFLRLPAQGAIARPGERIAQWVTVVVATPLLLVPDASPALVFLVIPILAWSALRATAWEALVQLVGVVVLAIVLTSLALGPFVDLPDRYDLPDQLRGVLLSAFCLSCAVVVVPCLLRVGEYVGAARLAANERDLVRGIVDGATGVAIIGTDEAGRITLFNPGAERLLGYRAEEMIGRHPSVLYTDATIAEKAAELGVRAEFLPVFLALIGRGMVNEPVRFRRKDGTERVHSMTLSRLGGAGEVTGYVSTSEDITDRLDAEQALRDALETERRAVERLQDVDAVKDQFVSTVSHELRTPITSILGYLEMLADGTLGALEATQVDALLRVQSNSHRLLSLIDDLLTLSRVAESGIRPSEEPFDLRDAVRAAYAVVAPAWEDPRVLAVALVLPEVPVPTYGDREMVERLVVNLLGNAVKFTDDGGSVEVSVRLDDDRHQSVLRVRDTGIGVPAEEQDQLFSRFFRSSIAEARAIPGSGLGLSIVRAVVEQHGGSIGVTSRVGEGTTIEVHLPVRPGMSRLRPDGATVPVEVAPDAR